MRVSQRGRAILRQLSTDRCMGCEGPHRASADIPPGRLFCSHPAVVDWRYLLGYATASKINHAAVIIDPQGTVIEASPSLFRQDQAFRVSSISHYQEVRKALLDWVRRGA